MTTLTRDKMRRGGFTLMELAIVFGVIGTIISAIWWAAGNAGELQKENNAASELQTVAQNINSLMAGQSFPGPFPLRKTQNMISAQAIPSSYVNADNSTADNPWAAQQFVVWAMSAKEYRLSFYNTSYKGCMALLLQATACQAGQVGCPTYAFTNFGNGTSYCYPGHACPSTFTPGTAQSGGWASMTTSVATAMCGLNTPNGGSVEFEYAL